MWLSGVTGVNILASESVGERIQNFLWTSECVHLCVCMRVCLCVCGL